MVFWRTVFTNHRPASAVENPHTVCFRMCLVLGDVGERSRMRGRVQRRGCDAPWCPPRNPTSLETTRAYSCGTRQAWPSARGSAASRFISTRTPRTCGLHVWSYRPSSSPHSSINYQRTLFHIDRGVCAENGGGPQARRQRTRQNNPHAPGQPTGAPSGGARRCRRRQQPLPQRRQRTGASWRIGASAESTPPSACTDMASAAEARGGGTAEPSVSWSAG